LWSTAYINSSHGEQMRDEKMTTTSGDEDGEEKLKINCEKIFDKRELHTELHHCGVNTQQRVCNSVWSENLNYINAIHLPCRDSCSERAVSASAGD
jgi:hypothetical protein